MKRLSFSLSLNQLLIRAVSITSCRKQFVVLWLYAFKSTTKSSALLTNLLMAAITLL